MKRNRKHRVAQGCRWIFAILSKKCATNDFNTLRYRKHFEKEFTYVLNALKSSYINAININ